MSRTISVLTIVLALTTKSLSREKFSFHNSNDCQKPNHNHKTAGIIPYTTSETKSTINTIKAPNADNFDKIFRQSTEPSKPEENYNDVYSIPMETKNNYKINPPNIEKQEDLLSDKTTTESNDVSEFYFKAYFPELNDFYTGTSLEPQEYHITIQPNIKDVRNKLSMKIQQTTTDFQNAIKTIKTMLSEETVEAISSLITLPSTEYKFIKSIIKILKVTIENVVNCISSAENQLMALPKRWSSLDQPCAVQEFKESWGIIENVHHIFQNAIFYIKNFINKLESCFSHEDSLIHWCVSDIFNDVPTYIENTVLKLDDELNNGIDYLKSIPEKVEKCEISNENEKKLLLPFLIIRDMVKCVLSNAEM